MVAVYVGEGRLEILSRSPAFDPLNAAERRDAQRRAVAELRVGLEPYLAEGWRAVLFQSRIEVAGVGLVQIIGAMRLELTAEGVGVYGK